MEVLEIMTQMLQSITFLSLKSIEVSSDFILNYLKKWGRNHSEISKTNAKTLIFLIWIHPLGVPGVSKDASGSTKHAI